MSGTTSFPRLIDDCIVDCVTDCIWDCITGGSVHTIDFLIDNDNDLLFDNDNDFLYEEN